ncbi:MAG: ribosome maturation factor RimP [Actinomycetaceae bacterium]|nr:ribosome maturation factor RimP [Actinomycetaceae bacterium]
MSKAVETRIEELAAPIVSNAELYLEGVTVTSGKNPLVRVTLDLPEGPGAVDAEKLQKVTREISAALDEADPIEGAYTLEVSTPGAERALETPRHFSRSIGRLVEIKTSKGERIKGHVLSVSDEAVKVEVAGKKGKPGTEVTVELAKITKARSRIDFGSLGR